MTTITDQNKVQSSTGVIYTGNQTEVGEANRSAFQDLLAAGAASIQPAQTVAQDDSDEATPHTFYATQTIGQDDDEKSSASDAVETFRRFAKAAKDGPAAMMRAQYLEKNNLTEEDLAAMPLAERKKIEDEIAEYIKQQIEEETGVASQSGGTSVVA
jgi:hypothetical protein